MYRFLLTSRWLAVSVLVLLAVAVCVLMGSWQLSRFEVRVDQHRSAEDQQSRAATEAAVPLAAVLPDARAKVPGDESGRVVSATGRYDAAHQLLVPNRSLDDRDGFYVLTPLLIGGGGAALPVVRGWLPGDASAAARSGGVPAVPTGEVTVVGALQYPEGSRSGGGSAAGGLPTGQLGIISAASLVNVLPYPVYGGWITATRPAAPLTAVPPAAPPNSGLDLKAFQNLGYTGQWFVFAGFVLFMWFRFARREAEARADAALGLAPDGDGDGLVGGGDLSRDPGRGTDPGSGRGPEPGSGADPDPDHPVDPGPGPGPGTDRKDRSAAHVA